MKKKKTYIYRYCIYVRVFGVFEACFPDAARKRFRKMRTFRQAWKPRIGDAVQIIYVRNARERGERVKNIRAKRHFCRRLHIIRNARTHSRTEIFYTASHNSNNKKKKMEKPKKESEKIITIILVRRNLSLCRSPPPRGLHAAAVVLMAAAVSFTSSRRANTLTGG